MLPNSPFSKADMQPLGTFSKRGTHVGLLMPSGQIIVNFSDSTHMSVLTDLANALGAELISIPGTWTFVPDENNEENPYKIIARRRS